MVKEPSEIELSSNEEADNDTTILTYIQFTKRAPTQILEYRFVKTKKMSRATLFKSLNKLAANGEVVKHQDTEDRRRTIYSTPGWYPPEKKAPSGVDKYLVEEMKTMVSQIIESGLEWADEGNADQRGDLGQKDGEKTIAEGYRLATKAMSLYRAVQHLQEMRTYNMPTLNLDSVYPGHVDPFSWSTTGKFRSVDPDRRGDYNLGSWMEYFLDVIDCVSRELDHGSESLHSKGRKATPRK